MLSRIQTVTAQKRLALVYLIGTLVNCALFWYWVPWSEWAYTIFGNHCQMYPLLAGLMLAETNANSPSVIWTTLSMLVVFYFFVSNVGLFVSCYFAVAKERFFLLWIVVLADAAFTVLMLLGNIIKYGQLDILHLTMLLGAGLDLGYGWLIYTSRKGKQAKA